MPMSSMRVTNTHGLEIDAIAKLVARAEKPYTRHTLTAVGMTLQRYILDTYGKKYSCE
jgi:hypothetical protein